MERNIAQLFELYYVFLPGTELASFNKISFFLEELIQKCMSKLRGSGFSQGVAESSVHHSVSKHDPIRLQTHKHDFSVLIQHKILPANYNKSESFSLYLKCKKHFRTSSKNNMCFLWSSSRQKKKCEIKELHCVLFRKEINGKSR